MEIFSIYAFITLPLAVLLPLSLPLDPHHNLANFLLPLSFPGNLGAVFRATAEAGAGTGV